MNVDNRIMVIGTSCHEPEVLTHLQECELVFTREEHAGEWLKKMTGRNPSQIAGEGNKLDEQVIDHWINQIQQELAADRKVAYISPFSPINIDYVVKRLAKNIGFEKIKTVGGTENIIDSLPAEISSGMDQLVTLDGMTLKGRFYPPFSPAHAVLILEPAASISLSDLQNLCSPLYPATHALWIFSHEPGELDWKRISLAELGKTGFSVHALFIPPLGDERSLEAFQDVIAHLRAPEGCPWDKKQTHSSLRTYLLEETYEALDTLDRGDLTGLQEELGDLILQIALHARIAEENNEFSMGDVLAGINKKIVFRHPHVFKDWKVDGETQVVQNWETLKLQEREGNAEDNGKGLLEGVPAFFPALAQAQAIQDRAARVGFDWKEIGPVLEKIHEEIDEIKKAENDTETAKEFGDLLFALVNLMRWKKIDAESVLRQTNLKFRKRFAYIERSAKEGGRLLKDMTLEEMDALWEQAKQFDD